MATQNLFEKYGIKDVADVTFYRIEKKEETYEAQRNISVASVLRGAVELRTVYPFDDNGISGDEGFQAYVFTDADIIYGENYDCDDEGITVTSTFTGSFKSTTEPTEKKTVSGVSEATITDGLEGVENYTQSEVITPDGTDITGLTFSVYNVKYSSTEEEGVYNVTFTATATATKDTTGELSTGVVGSRGTTQGDKNKRPNPGTHEYSYAEQAFMLFAKRQNLIDKTGVRYRFKNPAKLMGSLAFEDSYAVTPNSNDRAVVLGINSAGEDAASWSDGNYNVEEVSEEIGKLTDSFIAKAYDVTYDLYAELVVEDEMGYYNPKFLGVKYNNGAFEKTGAENYATAFDNVDNVLARAVMWGEDTHYSINDAIAALRQQQKILDADGTSAMGIVGLYGGYKVTGQKIPKIGNADTDDADANYSYSYGGAEVVSGLTSKYSLEAVLDALAALGYSEDALGKEIEVDYSESKESNRAIYVNTANASLAAQSYIYLLHNKNYKRLATDTEGVFSFTDKKGNKVYYQDKIFAGTEWLALVIIGNKGLIFVVNRHGERNVSRVAWMVGSNGFVTDKQAKSLVSNGLIHTTTITANDESFEATCSVKSLSVRKTVKTTNRYTPVLFLDTLKVSTIEQTAEEAYATGGHGNGNLIGWDFGKTITLSLEDALFTPASFSASLGAYDGDDFRKGVKETKSIDRVEKVLAKRSFIVPEGNQNGTPTEADKTAQAVFIDPNTMEPYPDGTPIAEGEIFLKYTRSVAYEGQSIGHTIEISADKFPGTYKIVGDTYIKNKDTGKEERFQFTIPQAKMNSERTITLEADGDPVVFDMDLTVLRPDDGVMVRFVQYNVIENEAENDGSTMVVGTENLNLLDSAELFKVGGAHSEEETYIGATEY